MNIQNLFKFPNIYLESEEFDVVSFLIHSQSLGRDFINGQFSLHHQEGGFSYLIRDRLGINKLFYHLNETSGLLTIGNNLYEVATAVSDYNKVFSVPPGHYLKINQRSLEKELRCYCDVSRVRPAAVETFDLSLFQSEIEKELSNVFQLLDKKCPDALFVVCLSGGLDSSVIAAFAKRHLRKVIATTFSYGEGSEVSADFAAAKKIAHKLNIDFLPLIEERNFDPELVDKVMIGCQDWRDFNVHCGWVNNEIGRSIRVKMPRENIIFLTGDLMNEFVADYTSVTYKETTYYPQPKISRDRLRRFLVYGLDTSDREIGVFQQHGITAVQPYSVLAEKYMGVPVEIINRQDSKEMLNLSLVKSFGLADLIVKSKVRAQVGGDEGGTLGLFHDNGITQEVLKGRWERIFSKTTGGQQLSPLIISGRYRV